MKFEDLSAYIQLCKEKKRLMLAHHYVLLESFINCSFYFLLYFKLLRYKIYVKKVHL